MNAEVIDIGRYINIPYELIIAKISHRAFRVWTLIAAGANQENAAVPVRQGDLAEQLGCSKSTIGRALSELLRLKLLSEAGKWNRGRCKSYSLNSASEKKHPSDLDELLATYGASWTQEYPCFDGAGDRPSLRECVKEALNNSTKIKTADRKVFIDGWLKVASHRWSEAIPAKIAPVEPAPAKDESESDEEREWIISRIRLDNEKQRRKEEMEARRMAIYTTRAQALANENAIARVDDPICRENYPLSWEIYRIQWAQVSQNIAA